MFKYEIILYWSNDDAAFVAEVPELPGCMAHGRTQEAALGGVKEAMRLRIETARESGDPVPAPKGDRCSAEQVAPALGEPLRRF